MGQDGGGVEATGEQYHGFLLVVLLSVPARHSRESCATAAGSAPAGCRRRSSRPGRGHPPASWLGENSTSPARCIEAVLDELGDRPVVVLARADDELDLVVAGQLEPGSRSGCGRPPAEPGVFRSTTRLTRPIRQGRYPARRWSPATPGSRHHTASSSKRMQLGCASGSPPVTQT